MNRSNIAPRAVLTLLAVTTLCLASSGQYIWADSTAPKKRQFAKDQVAVRRWILTFNPLGFLELPTAIGAGAGYRVNRNMELWSESSFLVKGLASGVSNVSGFRQILQLKRFIGHDQTFFLAAEIRYKTFSFSDTGRFYNSATSTTIDSVGYHDHHFFWAAGVQAGARCRLTKDGRLQGEITAGYGIKHKSIDRTGVPKTYEIVNNKIDLSPWDFIYSTGYTVYFPGSLRLIYSFGKRIL